MKQKQGDILCKRYEVIKAVGNGSQATVYKAKDLQTNQVVAVKQIRGIEFYSKDDKNQIEIEYKIMKQLNHPKIAKVLHFYKEESQYVLIIEYVDGQGLDKLVQQQLSQKLLKVMKKIDQNQFLQFIKYNQNRNDLLDIYHSFLKLKFQDVLSDDEGNSAETTSTTFTQVTNACIQEDFFNTITTTSTYQQNQLNENMSDETFQILYRQQPFKQHNQQQQNFSWINTLFEIFIQICDVLVYLDQQQITHRDLKPQNILVHFDDQLMQFNIKLIDFGLSTTKHQFFSKRDLVGTQGYIAPELYFFDQCQKYLTQAKQQTNFQPDFYLDESFQQLPENQKISLVKQQLNYYEKLILKQSHKTDTFALGSILFYMCCGYHPFIPTKNIEYETLQLKYNLSLPLDLAINKEDIPQYFKTTIKKLYNTDITKRYTAAQAKQFILEQRSAFNENHKTIIKKYGQIQPLNEIGYKALIQNKCLNNKVPIKIYNIMCIGDYGIGKTNFMVNKLFNKQQCCYILHKTIDQILGVNYIDSQGTEGRRCSLIQEITTNINLCVLCCHDDYDSLVNVLQWKHIVESSLQMNSLPQSSFCIIILENTIQAQNREPDNRLQELKQQYIDQNIHIFYEKYWNERLLSKLIEKYIKQDTQLEMQLVTLKQVQFH